MASCVGSLRRRYRLLLGFAAAAAATAARENSSDVGLLLMLLGCCHRLTCHIANSSDLKHSSAGCDLSVYCGACSSIQFLDI